MIYHPYAAVIGRVCGDDEDSIEFFEDVTTTQACDTFEYAMREGDCDTREVFINAVLVSDSPIEVAV